MSTPSNPIMVSLVVCTRNRASYLPEMLASLQKLTTPHHLWELIVVNNGSNDGTSAIAAEFAEKFAGNIRLVEEPRRGLSLARNTGWKSASGVYIAFTDDDCYPAPDFLDAVLAAFERHRVAYLGGRVLLHDSQDAPVTIQLREDTVHLEPFSFIEAGLIHGANLCVKRSVLESLGGFDPLFGAGGLLRSGEDTDLLIRASAGGLPGVYDPSPVVSHHHRRRTPQDIGALQQNYAYGRGALTAKALVTPSIRNTYGKHFYWRCRSFLRDGRWDELTGEVKGFFDYFVASKVGRTLLS